jgi:hypothetical protein
MTAWILALLTLLWLSVTDCRTLHIPFSGLFFFHIISIWHIWEKGGITPISIAVIWCGSLLFWIVFKKLSDFFLKKESIGGGDILLFPAFSLWFSGIQYAVFLGAISFFLALTGLWMREKRVPLLPAFFFSFFLFFLYNHFTICNFYEEI